MVNKTHLDFKAPFGGYKQSGNAREWGLAGLEEFLITKTVNVPLEDYRAIVYGDGK
jgi:acyl-CoA reductase-like NAD-dependent aldehyde dehydrogenase